MCVVILRRCVVESDARIAATKKAAEAAFFDRCSINYFALLADAFALGAGAGGGATTGFSAERV